jgi:ribosomal protein L33
MEACGAWSMGPIDRQPLPNNPHLAELPVPTVLHNPLWQQKKRGWCPRITRMRTLSTAILRTIVVRLVSIAKTGYFYATQRRRQGGKLSFIKYDPIGMSAPLHFELHAYQVPMFQ